MRSRIASALAVSALVGLATSAFAGTTDPYRSVTNVLIVPEVDSKLVDIYVECHDPAGNPELWELQAYGGGYDQAASMSLSIDDAFQFGIETSLAPFSITVTGAGGDAAQVDATTYLTDADYQAFLDATGLERGFLVELLQEYKVYGTMQGVDPTVVLPDADDPPGDWALETEGFFFGPMPARLSATAPQAGNRQKCINDITWGLGPKPGDCEGAIDEYICCIWEMYVDACTRQRDCEDGSAWLYLPCMAAAVVANGVDSSACILGLPIPGA